MKFCAKFSGNLPGDLYKFLLVMRFVIILFFVGIMQVSATTYGQKLTLNKKNITLKQVFKEIKSQTGYDVLWQANKLDVNQVIDADFDQANLGKVMDQCLSGQRLTYIIDDKSIVIRQKNVMPLGDQRLSKDSVYYRGIVNDENGKPLPGATVKLKGSRRSTLTSSDGNFMIRGGDEATLIFTFIGYLEQQVNVVVADARNVLNIKLKPDPKTLTQVDIVSTGYQDKSKESATGSFELITKEQLQHSTDPNLLKRLDGITTSLNFNPSSNYNPTNSSNTAFGTSPLVTLTIRGRNTLNPINTDTNTSGEPLVVIDGIASAYSIDQLNPNDVESITILKDAAASSIWGSRAANGVIVVKTKKGAFDKPLNISFNSNLNVTDKLNLFYTKQMSTSDFIDAQIFKFNAAQTNLPAYSITQATAAVSPVADILDQIQKGLITQQQGNAQINALRGNDIRNNLNKYIDRDAVTQSYSLSLDGGSKKIAYRLSAGYDNSINNTINSGSDRFVFNYNTTFQLLKNLSVSSNIFYSQSHTSGQAPYGQINSGSVAPPFYPYTQLVDAQGNPLTISKGYRTGFLNLLSATYGNNILNYDYKPLDDINEGYSKTEVQSMGAILSANYNFSPLLSANVSYNYTRTLSDLIQYESQDSWYMRDLINQFTDPVNFGRNIPLGGFYSPIRNTISSQTLRGQLNFNKSWGKNQLTAIAGVDVSTSYSLQTGAGGYFGYDPTTLSGTNRVIYNTTFNKLFTDPFGASTSQIPLLGFDGFADYRTRALSEYSNADYSYDKKYNLSASIRKDGSSEFGPGTNKTGTPYYSFGGAWVINNESFYKISWLPYLKLRVTYGYNGNVNPEVTAAPTLIHYDYNNVDVNTGLPYTSIADGVSNAKLRPERTGILNLGLDFGLKNNRINGSFEYYQKKTIDLISQAPIDPTTGYSNVTYNTADLKGSGIDFSLNSKNLQLGKFSWGSSFLFSYNRVIVTKVYTGQAETEGQVIGGFPQYNVGSDLSRIFAYKWAGLDPKTGDPRVYAGSKIVTLDGTNDASYNDIYYRPISGAHYFGSAVPVYFGSLRNTFSYGNLSLSANIQYRFDYYFRRPLSTLVNYYGLFNTNAISGAEYANRWQKPGDELATNVPSLRYVTTQYRDEIYQNADINVLKGDNIRLQEVNFLYTINSKKKWIIKNPRLYANVSNLGIIWRANKYGLDPDVYDFPQPRTYSLGFSANF